MVITLFDVPRAADEAFLAVRDGGTVFRALRDDADYRFAVIGPEAPGKRPFPAHRGVYEPIHEDGVADGAQGTTLINPFEVPEGEDERFLDAWEAARAVLSGRQGYQGTRLYRSVGPAEFRFVNVARWSSPLMFARALQDPAFQEAAARMPFASHPALYQVV